MSDPVDPDHARYAALARDHDLARNHDPRIGIAYDVALRDDPEPRSSTARRAPTLQRVLSFRLHRVGADGQLLAPVAVELRGRTITGSVAEGDLVKLPKTAPSPGSIRHGGALTLTTVANLSSGAEVAAGAPAGTRALWVLLAVLLGLAAVGVAAVAVFLLRALAAF